MLSNSFRTAFAVSSFLSMTTYASAQTMASPSPVSGLRAIQFSGCFSSSYPLQDMGSYTFQSSGACQNECGAQNKPVMGLTSGTNCFCGDQLPPSDSKVDDTDCNTPCAGYNKEFCGAANRWTVYLTGTTLNQINNAPDPKSSSSSGPSPASETTASVVTAPGQTVVRTVPANAGATTSSTPTATAAASSGPNKAGIAAGVVIGVVVLAALIGGVFLFLRRRKQQLAEKEYQRHNSVSAFVETGRPPGTSHSTSGDSRLDPRVFERRQSDGSIADNEDYSRRILKVTNPDRS